MNQSQNFNWRLPETPWDRGEIFCSRELRGCGRWHEFTLGGEGEIEFDLSWESQRGEFWCDKFEMFCQELAEEEWELVFRSTYVEEKENLEWERMEQDKKARIVEAARVSVKLSERQFEKEMGSYRPVGYWKKDGEIFVCGICSKDLRGAKRHGKARNRNNPAFWGIKTEKDYKVLCLGCISKHYYKVIRGEKKRTFRKYLGRGYW